MKKQLFYLSVILSIVILFGSCGKYEDGPAFSLLTKTARLTGEWKIEKTFYNGTEQDASLTESLIITFEKDGTGNTALSSNGLSFKLDLEWKFGDKKETLKVRSKNPDGTWNEWDESTILKLTNSELWIKNITSAPNEEQIVHFAAL